LLKYFFISFISHVIVLGLTLLNNGIDNRDRVVSVYPKNTTVDMIPFVDSILPQDNFVSVPREVLHGEINSFSAQTKRRTIEPAFTNPPQHLKPSSYQISTEDNTAKDRQKNTKTEPTLPLPKSHLSKKLIITKTPNLVETALSKTAATQQVGHIKPVLPSPKPGVKNDSRKKNLVRRTNVEPSSSSKLQYPLIDQLHDKNTATGRPKSLEILRFNEEFLPQIASSKNTQLSTKGTFKQKKNKQPFQSSQPKVWKGPPNHQCKLVSMQKTKTKLNIRKIQNQIKSSSVTISNILAYRSTHKSDQISISNLLASNSNTLLPKLQRKTDNIGFLLTSHNFQDNAKNIVCATN